jgi:rare lipoprotein A
MAAPVAVAVVDERSVIRQEVPAAHLKGDSVGGRFLPAPKVTMQPVQRSNIYIQAGAFSVAENAERLRSQLGGIAQASIAPATVGGHAFYRVRVGPIGTVEEADRLLARIAGAGAQNAKIVVD